MRTSNTVKISTLACAVVAALVGGQAMAAGFELHEDSINAMGRAYAGTASDWGDAAVVVNNPAAMALFDKTTAQTDFTAIDLHGTFSGSGTDSAPGTPIPTNSLGGGNGGNIGDTTPIPAFHMIFPFGNGFAIGASMTSPFGLKTEYDPGWVGRYEALKSEVKTYDFTLSGSFKFNEMWSVGGSLIVQRANAELSNAIDFGALVAPQYYPIFQPGQGPDGLGDIKGHDTDLGWDAGVLFRPTPDTNIGLNYRSKINQTLTGHATFTVPSAFQATFQQLGVFQNTAASAPFSTPSELTFSVSQRFGQNFTLSGNFERTNWSSLQNLTVNFANPNQPATVEQFNWKDSNLFSLGMDWKVAPEWVLRAGIGRDDTPTNDATRDPRLPDDNRTLYTLGMGWMPNSNVTLNFSYMRINIDSPSINNVGAVGSPGATLSGTYDADANLFGVSAMFSF
jgi:long-chain fatty acid transport protein